MRSLDDIRAALERSFQATETLCAGLEDADWQAQSLCPDWNVRGVVSHVTSIEAVLADWLPEDAAALPPLDKMTEFERETAELDNASFLERVRATFDHRRRNLTSLTDADLQRPSWTPVGPKTYGRFLEIRVFDFWVHERDVATPLGIATDDTGVDAEIALGEVEGSLGYIVGKKIGLPDGKSIAFHLTGPIVRDLNIAVDGKATRVDQLPNPDVEVSTDSTTFIQLACGRIDPQRVIDSGAISWIGDAELGERAARNLRFTM
ncbi:MAG: maleylpyruvate isomerase family mycothiol-dependent enzyme [Mycobacterium sp.]|nr:maleylpyruvate isomerase family mycothiol-dependent enzyme [Mycobacterium sp.]